MTPALERVLDRSGLTALLGPHAVVPASDELFEALDTALARARDWVRR